MLPTVSRFCREVRAGNIQLHSLDWPLFLYDEDLLRPGKVRPGLLRSEFLVRVSTFLHTINDVPTNHALETFLTLYKGPQSADRLLRDASRSTGKPSLCVKYNITEVTPDMIFYVVALV